MPIKVPYYKQSTDYTCGPASLRMVFEYFGKKHTEKELAKLLKTNPRIGTHTDSLEPFVKSHGFYTHTKKGSALEDLKQSISKGHPVIVDYYIPETNERHLSVVIHYDDTHIIMNDPWNGEGYKILTEEFKKQWVSENNRYSSWMMSVSDKPIVLNKEIL